MLGRTRKEERPDGALPQPSSHGAGCEGHSCSNTNAAVASTCVGLGARLPEAAGFLAVFFLCFSIRILSVSRNELTQPKLSVCALCTPSTQAPSISAAESGSESSECSLLDSQAPCPRLPPLRRQSNAEYSQSCTLRQVLSSSPAHV